MMEEEKNWNNKKEKRKRRRRDKRNTARSRSLLEVEGHPTRQAQQGILRLSLGVWEEGRSREVMLVSEFVSDLLPCTLGWVRCVGDKE